MEKTYKCIISNMCMVYKGDMILVINRTKSDWPGLSFPGGHLEENETLEESVVREMKILNYALLKSGIGEMACVILVYFIRLMTLKANLKVLMKEKSFGLIKKTSINMNFLKIF